MTLLALTLAAPPARARQEDALERAADALAAGDLPTAAEAFREGARVAEADGDLEAAGRALNNACVLFNDIGRAAEALAACTRSLELRTGEPDAARARTVNNLGLSLLNLGRLDEAERRFDQALELNRSLHQAEGMVVNQTNLAVVAERRGDFARASRLLREAIQGVDDAADEDWARARDFGIRLNLGVLRERIGDHRTALEILSPLQMQAHDDHESATLELDLAVALRNLGDPVAALARLERAEAAYRRLGDRAGLAAVSLNRGIARYLDLGQAEAAVSELERAATDSAGAGDPLLQLESQYHLGRALAGLGRDRLARDTLEQSLSLAHRTGAREGVWSASFGLALIDEASGDLEAARQHLAAALGAIEQERSQLERGAERGLYFADKRAVYAAAVRVARERLQAGDDSAAVEAMELVQRAKARLLLDALPGGGSAGAEPRPATVAEIVPHLGGAALIELFLGERSLYRFVLDGRGLRFEGRGSVASLLPLLRSVHGALAAGARPSPLELRELGHRLLGDVWSGDPGKRTLIAADGVLRYLPFELLPFDDSGRPLLLASTVRYLPSGSFLLVPRADAVPDAPRLLAFGVSAARPQPSPGAVAAPLPAVRDELEAVADALRGTSVVRLDGQATETELARLMPAGSRVLQLATHTRLDEERGGEAAVVLWPDPLQDGLLHPDEVLRLGGARDLTLLGACSTQLGLDVDARALDSLVGSFLAGGSRAVVSTLWDVGDQATAVFSAQLAWELGRGRDAATAMTNVKRRMRADPRWASPSLWAPFVLTGEAPVVALPRAATWPLGIGAVGGLLAVGAALAFARTRRRRAPALR